MQEDKANTPLRERTISLSDRLAFKEAKQKELAPFFQNDVWIFDQESNARPDRILRAKFILNWKTNPDGTPRVKARLICQGFKPIHVDPAVPELCPQHLIDAGLSPLHCGHLHSLP